MPSVANCNVPNKTRRKAQGHRKAQKARASAGIRKNARGTAASSVLFPTHSGKGAPLSSKKARKVEQARAHALRRTMEKEMERNGQVEMTGKTPPMRRERAESWRKYMANETRGSERLECQYLGLRLTQ